jgi:hypothetical protein
MSVTINQGLLLKIPDHRSINWYQAFVDDFAKKISSHDHTGSGKGLQLGAGSLQANAVITSKILDGNVTTAKIPDKAITGIKLQDIGAGTSFTPVLSETIGNHIASQTCSGRYYRFGPFVLMVASIDVVFNGGALSLKFTLPVLGSTADGSGKIWPGGLLTAGGQSSATLLDSIGYPVIGSGTTDIFQIKFGPDSTSVNTDELFATVWALYPSR